jgi:DNA-binding XRE family transcriptional regulator
MQKDLAEAINLTENTICRVKKGLPIRCKSAKKIADYFNYEIHDLFPLLFINGAVQETRVYQRLKREAQMN